MKSQAHAVVGRGLAEIVDCGSVTKSESTANSPATQPRHKRRNLYREAAIETLLILRQRFPQAFARLNARIRRPLKIGIHHDLAAAMPFCENNNGLIISCNPSAGNITTHSHFTDWILRAGVNYQFH
jgi:hypothetical protein